MFKHMDAWEIGWFCLFFILVGIAIISITTYSFSSKEFKGYYLNHETGTYNIKINWENAPDDTAFKTFDGEVALRVLNQLKKEN